MLETENFFVGDFIEVGKIITEGGPPAFNIIFFRKSGRIAMILAEETFFELLNDMKELNKILDRQAN